MRFLQTLVLTILFIAMAAPFKTVQAEASLDIRTAPYGLYKIDPEHTSITFKINHLGFSHYTGRFDRVEGYMNFNNLEPEQSNMQITVYTNSINTNNAKLDEDLRGGQWLNVIQYPLAKFRSTRVDRTGPMTGRVTGDFTLLGVKHPLVMNVTFVGAGTNLFSKKQVLGFSAVASLDRSDFGMSNLLPMLGNEVVLEIEVEFDKD